MAFERDSSSWSTRAGATGLKRRHGDFDGVALPRVDLHGERQGEANHPQAAALLELLRFRTRAVAAIERELSRP